MSEIIANVKIPVTGRQFRAVLDSINDRMHIASRCDGPAYLYASGCELLLENPWEPLSFESNAKVATWVFGKADAVYTPAIHLWIEDIQLAMSKVAVPFPRVDIAISERSYTGEKLDFASMRIRRREKGRSSSRCPNASLSIGGFGGSAGFRV